MCKKNQTTIFFDLFILEKIDKQSNFEFSSQATIEKQFIFDFSSKTQKLTIRLNVNDGSNIPTLGRVIPQTAWCDPSLRGIRLPHSAQALMVIPEAMLRGMGPASNLQETSSL